MILIHVLTVLIVYALFFYRPKEILAVQIFGLPPIVGGEKMARIASRSAPCPHSLSNPLNTLCMHTNTFSVCTQILSLCMHTNTLVYGTLAQLQISTPGRASVCNARVCDGILIQMWNLAGSVTNGCDDV